MNRLIPPIREWPALAWKGRPHWTDYPITAVLAATAWHFLGLSVWAASLGGIAVLVCFAILDGWLTWHDATALASGEE